ncbi:MAG TPA: hypothetical protein VF678_06465 [bacterium]
MPTLTPMELTVLALLLGLALVAVCSLMLLRRFLLSSVQDAAATHEILRAHPELREDLKPHPWTGSVNLGPEPRTLRPTSGSRA